MGLLQLAAVLCFLICLAHSYLGEKFILIRLFEKGEVPQLFGSDNFPKRTLRFAWHIMSVLGCGFAFLLWQVGSGHQDLRMLFLQTTSVVFILNGLLAFTFTRGKHLSWIVFFAIAGISAYESGAFP